MDPMSTVIDDDEEANEEDLHIITMAAPRLSIG